MRSRMRRRGLAKPNSSKSKMAVIGELITSSVRPEINNLVGSCFNAFSRVDIRVDVKIPGGVNAYVIDLRGERCA